MNIFTIDFWKERDIELYIGKLLRYGVLSASFITVLGGIIYIFQQPEIKPDFKVFEGTPEYLRSLTTIFPRVLEGDGLAVIQLGVAVLIATPIVRVAFSVFAFAIEKDRLYVIITLIVLTIIICNLYFGIED